MRYLWHATYYFSLLFSNNCNENEKLWFQDQYCPSNGLRGGAIFSVNVYGTYERGLVITGITMACDLWMHLLCRDRSAAARSCACFPLLFYYSVQSICFNNIVNLWKNTNAQVHASEVTIINAPFSKSSAKQTYGYWEQAS